MTISPSSQAAPAGTTVTYTVSVTNNDSSGCAPSTVSLQASAGAGWTAAFATPSLAVNPGSVASTTLRVTSPVSAADGAYTLGASATNSSAAGYTGSASATYVIASCARASPTAKLSSAPGVTAGTPVTYTLSVTNNDNAICAPSTFSLAAGVPSGWAAAFASSALTLSPGVSASTTLQVTSPSTATSGSYTVSSSATNTGAPSYTASASATCTIASSTSVSSLSVTVSTAQASYKRKQSVSITAGVTSGGSPVANATVVFTVTKPNGTVATGTATTSSTGAVRW